MIKDIIYNGITTVPSDYENPDGALSSSLNLISEDMGLRPIFQPKLKFNLTEGNNVVGIHRTAHYTHFLVYNKLSYDLSWTNEDGTQHLSSISRIPNFEKLEVIGNTLIVLTPQGPHYYIWKPENNLYKYLGKHLPEIEISFGLQGEAIRSNEFRIDFHPIFKDYLYNEFTDVNKDLISNQVLAKVNKFIAENSLQKGKFLFPFFVRYAYRLYDGTLTMHSAPALMVTYTGVSPRCYVRGVGGEGVSQITQISYAEGCQLMGVFHKLDYAVTNSIQIQNLKEWHDIVRSVDIFVSKPIYTYDQSGKCSKFVKGFMDMKSFSICKHINQKTSTETYPLRYQFNTYEKMWAHTFDPSGLTFPSGILKLPERSKEAIKEDIKNCSLFYLLESIKLDSLSTERTLVPVEDDYLASLVNREVMTDDYDSHDLIIPKYAFAYNARMNFANIDKILFKGQGIFNMIPYSDGFVTNYVGDTPPTIDDVIFEVKIYYYIKQDGRDIIVGSVHGTIAKKVPILYLFYPNVNAYKAIIELTYPEKIGGGTCRYEVLLEQHRFLNGSFYFNGWQDIPLKNITDIVPQESSEDSKKVSIPNKIYTSEINNPFLFPVTSINSVGTGTIIGISSTTKALSQGQFGQFPLYAFTNEGIWALEVSQTGTYSAKQPVTRDVCINPDSITQLDDAVLFSTSRGIMLISGSETVCITDNIKSSDPFNVLTLPGMQELHTLLGHATDTCFPTIPLLTYLKGCSMIYDYVHQHIIVFNKDYTYSYVFSLKSKEWGMMYSTFTSSINAYPDALAMTKDYKLVSFSDTDEKDSTGLFVTRPIKLDAPDVLKTIETCILRGFFNKGDVQTVIWGSRDLYNWHLIGSSANNYIRGICGTPYKYFRIGGITRFKPRMSLSRISMQFKPKYTNTLR